MATRGNNGNKPDLSDLKARLGLAPTAKPGAAGPPPGAQGPPGAQMGPPQGGPAAQGPPGAQMGPPGAMPPQQQMTQQAPPGAYDYGDETAAIPSPMGQVPSQGAPYGNAPNYGGMPQQAPQPQAQPHYSQQPQQQPQVARPAQPGPPPGARRPKARSSLSDLPVQHVEIDEKVAERPVFSPAVIGLFVGMLVVGLIFGYMGARSGQARQLYDQQTESAVTLAKEIAPKIDASKQVVNLIAKMDPTTPNYELAKQLTEIKFVPEPGMINAKTVFLGGDIIYNLTTFISKASALQEMIKRHDYLTTQDKEELDQLVQGNELLQGEKNFAVIYNHKQLLDHIKDKKTDKDFKPANGRLVSLDKFDVDEEGKVTYASLANQNSGTWPVLGVVPLEKDEIIKTGGQNALQRYKRRVEFLKFYALDLQKSYSGMLTPIEELAARGSAPLLQLSAPDAPSAPTPGADNTPAAPPAEAPAAEEAPPAE